MDRDLVLEWVEALEGGAYWQGKNFLAVVDTDTGVTRYCCLGILCKIAAKRGIGSWKPSYNGDSWSSGGDWSMPENAVCEAAGLATDGALGTGDMSQLDPRDSAYLAYMNDNLGKTFREIAQHIRETILDPAG